MACEERERKRDEMVSREERQGVVFHLLESGYASVGVVYCCSATRLISLNYITVRSVATDTFRVVERNDSYTGRLRVGDIFNPSTARTSLILEVAFKELS